MKHTPLLTFEEWFQEELGRPFGPEDVTYLYAWMSGGDQARNAYLGLLEAASARAALLQGQLDLIRTQNKELRDALTACTHAIS
jgi:hypothetical protein